MKFPGNMHIGLIPIIYGLTFVCESAKIMHLQNKVDKSREFVLCGGKLAFKYVFFVFFKSNLMIIHILTSKIFKSRV